MVTVGDGGDLQHVRTVAKVEDRRVRRPCRDWARRRNAMSGCASPRPTKSRFDAEQPGEGLHRADGRDEWEAPRGHVVHDRPRSGRDRGGGRRGRRRRSGRGRAHSGARRRRELHAASTPVARIRRRRERTRDGPSAASSGTDRSRRGEGAGDDRARVAGPKVGGCGRASAVPRRTTTVRDPGSTCTIWLPSPIAQNMSAGAPGTSCPCARPRSPPALGARRDERVADVALRFSHHR